MAVQQIAASYQSDGNFSQLDLQDKEHGGPVLRIETFRSSQQANEDGTTRAGSSVLDICGLDHLTGESNRIFRHIYSETVDGIQTVFFEIWEKYEESGAFEVRIRDVDHQSNSFGHVVVSSAEPRPDNKYIVSYGILKPTDTIQNQCIVSPITRPIAESINAADIGSDWNNLGEPDDDLPVNPLVFEMEWNGKKSKINALFQGLDSKFQSIEKYRKFIGNAKKYLRMGDFRDKCIHDATNLVGEKKALASEYIIVRAYRASLVMIGRLCDPDMYKHTRGLMAPTVSSSALVVDPKPGVYAPFLSAYISNIEVYQLGLDKVHSDYSGVPMKRHAGSRLETGATPVADSTRFNRSIAEIAFAFYVSPDMRAVKALIALG